MANPFSIAFEEGLPAFDISPGAQATVTEVPGSGPFPPTLTPVNSIRSDQAWGVRVEWGTDGALSPLLAGTWEVTVYLDAMGGGPFTVPGNVLSTVLLATDPAAYAVDFSFPAGLVPAGAYRMAVTVTMRGPAPGLVPGPIGGVGDGPLLQFYNA